MLIPKFPEIFTHKLRAMIFGFATIVSIIVSLVVSNFMSDSIVQTILWIVFAILTTMFLLLTIYSTIKAYFINE